MNLRPLTDAVVALLRTTLDPIPVGDGTAPTPPPGEDILDLAAGAYAVVWRIPSGNRNLGEGFTGDPSSHLVVRYQVTAAGIQRDQCEDVAEVALEALSARTPGGGYVNTLAPTGMAVLWRHRVGDVPMDVLGTMQCGGLVDIAVGPS